MQTYQRQFIELALAQNALSFGEFTLKSGRVSPYFFNMGTFQSGKALAQLGELYATAIADKQITFDMLFGPAYKGICLVASTAIACYTQQQRDIPYAFNRKEAKTHGEGGKLVGAPLTGNILIVDDVITAGTAIREAMQYVQQADAHCHGVLVALDRQERCNDNSQSTIQQIEASFSIKIYSLITLQDIMDYLQDAPELKHHAEAIEAYRQRYGII